MTFDNELIRLLDDAAGVLAGVGELNMFCPFDTGAEFAREIRSLRDRIGRRDWSAVESLLCLFGPTGPWDDAVGPGGIELANRIMKVLKEFHSQSNPCE